MSKNPNQKLKLLYLYQILLQRTDENHKLTTDELRAALERCGITAERKSIYSDIEALQNFGLDVICQRGTGGGYYVASREFELPERQVYVSERVKTLNEQIYYNIDALHAAISNDVQITFRYFNWVLNFSASPRIQKQYRRDGARYHVSPWALTWDNENYYLIAFDHDAGEIRHYRVDKMDSLVQTDLPREGKQLFDDRFDAAAYSRKVFGMFSGEEKTVKLKCLNRFIGVMLDRFGSSLRLFPADNEHFYLDVDVVVSPQFFSWVFSLEGDVRIVNPPEVCEAFEKQIHQFID